MLYFCSHLHLFIYPDIMDETTGQAVRVLLFDPSYNCELSRQSAGHVQPIDSHVHAYLDSVEARFGSCSQSQAPRLAVHRGERGHSVRPGFSIFGRQLWSIHRTLASACCAELPSPKFDCDVTVGKLFGRRVVVFPRRSFPTRRSRFVAKLPCGKLLLFFFQF